MATKNDKSNVTTTMQAPPTETALEAHDFGDDAGLGFDNTTGSDMVVPMIIVVNDKSKLIKNNQAKCGQLFVTGVGTAHDFLEVVPAITDHCYIEWTPRDAGGGFKGRHALESQVVKDTMSVAKSRVGKQTTMRRKTDGKLEPTGTELVEAFEIWLVLGDGEGKPNGYALMSCSSMKIGPYKQWITKLRHFQLPRPNSAGRQDVPLFANRTMLRVVDARRNQDEFKQPSFDPFTKSTDNKTPDLVASLLGPKHPMYLAGKELRDLVLAKKIAGDYSSTESEDQMASGSGGAADESAASF